MRDARAIVLGLAVLAVSHGAIFVRLAEAPALAIAAWRVSLATLCFLLVNGAVPDLRRVGPRERWRILLAGLLLAGHFATWIASLELTSISHSVVLVQTAPVWVILFGMAFAASRPSFPLATSAALGVLGASVVSWAPADASGTGSLHGDLLALAGGACLGAYLLVAGGLRQSFAFLPFMILCNGVAALGLWALALSTGTRVVGFDPKTWLAIGALALVSQVIGHGGCNWALARLAPGVVAIALLGEPVLASLLGWLIFGEAVSVSTMAGAIMILLAVYLTIRNPPPLPGAR